MWATKDSESLEQTRIHALLICSQVLLRAQENEIYLNFCGPLSLSFFLDQYFLSWEGGYKIKAIWKAVSAHPKACYANHLCIWSFKGDLLCFFLVFFLSFSEFYSFLVHVKRSWKLKKGLTEALPLKSPFLNASSVVPPLIPLICDFTLNHHITHLHSFCQISFFFVPRKMIIVLTKKNKNLLVSHVKKSAVFQIIIPLKIRKKIKNKKMVSHMKRFFSPESILIQKKKKEKFLSL